MSKTAREILARTLAKQSNRRTEQWDVEGSDDFRLMWQEIWLTKTDELLAALADAGYVIEQDWQPIDTAPQDGTEVLVYASGREYDLPNYVGPCSYHPDAGWCVCELREPKYWRPIQLSED